MQIKVVSGLCILLAFVALPDCSLAVEGENCTNVDLADIYVYFDSSNSIYPVGNKKELTFVCNLAKGVTVGPKNVQFACGTFSSTVVHSFDLNTYWDADKLCEAVFAIEQLRTNTDTAGALDRFREGRYLFDSSKGARNGVKKVLIVITDGQSDNTTATLIAAAKVRDSGITIITVGVGSVNVTELDGISGKPGSALTVKSFADIETIKKYIYQQICQEPPATTVKPCPPPKKISICFALDSSGSIKEEYFYKNVVFVTKVVNKVDANYWSACTYGTNVREVSNLTTYRSVFLERMELAQYQDSTTQTDRAITFCSLLQKTIPDDYVKLIVVVTDGKSTQPPKTQVAAQNARDQGNTILAVGVGADADVNELNGITGDANLVFSATDYNDLVNRVIDITSVACGVTTPRPAPATTTTEPPTTTTEPPTTSTTEPPTIVCITQTAPSSPYTEPTTTTQPPTPEPCPPADPLDIVYCVDSSSSIPRDKYNQSKTFLITLTHTFKIGPDDTHVSASVYGTHNFPAFGLSSDPSYIQDKLENLQYRGSTTGTDTCIDYARGILKAGRAWAKKLLVVVTDGKSNSQNATAIAAQAIHDDGVISFAVGVGNDVYEPELNLIASDSGKVFRVSSFDTLIDVIDELAAGTCNEIRRD